MHRKWRVPAHTVAEAMQAYRGLLIRGRLTQSAADNAIDQLTSLRFEIVAPDPKLIQRTWQLRHNLTVYDAMYVALAEELSCELLTADARISRAQVAKCEIVTLPLADGEMLRPLAAVEPVADGTAGARDIGGVGLRAGDVAVGVLDPGGESDLRRGHSFGAAELDLRAAVEAADVGVQFQGIGVDLDSLGQFGMLTLVDIQRSRQPDVITGPASKPLYGVLDHVFALRHHTPRPLFSRARRARSAGRRKSDRGRFVAAPLPFVYRVLPVDAHLSRST